MMPITAINTERIVIGHCKLCGEKYYQLQPTLFSTTSMPSDDTFEIACECRDEDGNRSIWYQSDDPTKLIHGLDSDVSRLSDEVWRMGRQIVTMKLQAEADKKVADIRKEKESQKNKRGFLTKLFGG